MVRSSSEEIDVGVYGTPCTPFSKQRAKRHVSGSVISHDKYQVTFEEALGWMAEFLPKASTMEQVRGFNEKISVDEDETPMERRAG